METSGHAMGRSLIKHSLNIDPKGTTKRQHLAASPMTDGMP
jgi:hypothetical protein